jgi:hypothetical protein
LAPHSSVKDARASGRRAQRDNMDILRHHLNRILHITGFLYNPFKEELYNEECKKEFRNVKYKDPKIKDLFIELFKNGMISYKDMSKKNKDDFDVDNMKVDQIRDLLINGKIIINQYGRANMDVNNRDIIMYNQQISWVDKFKETKKKLNGLKTDIYAQILTLMGIILAVITFINLGIDFARNPKYLELSFFKQVLAAISLFIPMLISITVIILGLFGILKLIELIKSKK